MSLYNIIFLHTSAKVTQGHSFVIQQKYKEDFEKTKGKMIGLKGLQDDLNIAHSVHASRLQSDVSVFLLKTARSRTTTQC